MAAVESHRTAVTLDASSARLIAELADGRFHSGAKIADMLGISRAAVWKRLQHIKQQLGLNVHAVRGRGYRLAAPLELLNEHRIRAELSDAAGRYVEALFVHAVVDSTNRSAMSDLPKHPGSARVWLAEHQTAGRGRRGRHWVTAFGAGLSLSLAWRFDRALSELAGLSLLAGVVVAETLEAHGVTGLMLKWPNDVLIGDRKLCGILVEASGATDGPATAVIGIGLNVMLPRETSAQIDRPCIDLAHLADALPSRNRLAGTLLSALIEACAAYSTVPSASFIERWRRYDRLTGRQVNVLRADRTITGIYRGINEDGAMLLETEQGLESHLAGEVSLRPVTT